VSIKSGQNVTVDFTTQTPSTGAATNADTLPTGTLVINGADDAAVVTVTNKGNGYYKAAVTLPALSAGDLVQIRIAATVATIAGVAVIWQDVADTKRVSDLNDLAAGAAMDLVADAVDAAALKADAVAEIQAGLSTLTAAEVNAQVDDALNTAIPGSPTAGSINERVKAIDDKLPSASYLRGTADSDGGLCTADKADIQTECEDAIDAKHVQVQGDGAITFTYTLTSSVDGTPIANCWIGVYTEAAMSNLVASGYTDNFGQITFYLDAGTYYLKRVKSGWNFANPDVETVS